MKSKKPKRHIHSKMEINAEYLNLVQSGDDFQNTAEPDLTIGTIVRLNSGGPAMLVVDFEPDGKYVCGYKDGEKTTEITLPRECIHRVRDLW